MVCPRARCLAAPHSTVCGACGILRHNATRPSPATKQYVGVRFARDMRTCEAVCGTTFERERAQQPTSKALRSPSRGTLITHTAATRRAASTCHTPLSPRSSALLRSVRISVPRRRRPPLPREIHPACVMTDIKVVLITWAHSVRHFSHAKRKGLVLSFGANETLPFGACHGGYNRISKARCRADQGTSG